MILVSWQRRGILLELDANGPELLRRWVPSLGRIVGATSPKLIGLTDPKGLMEDPDFEILPSFGEIQKVFLYGSKITDSGLQSICRLGNLTNLTLDNIPLTDRGFQDMGKLRKLLFLELRDVGMTDESLDRLSGIPELLSVSLHEKRVTDFGLITIRKWESLRTLNVRGANVTLKGVQDFWNERPEVSIRRNLWLK